MSQQKVNITELDKSFADLEKAMVQGFNMEFMLKPQPALSMVGGIDSITSAKGSPNMATIKNNGFKPAGVTITEEIQIPLGVDASKLMEEFRPKMEVGFKQAFIFGTESHRIESDLDGRDCVVSGIKPVSEIYDLPELSSPNYWEG